MGYGNGSEAAGAQEAEGRCAWSGSPENAGAGRAYPACFRPKKLEIAIDFPRKTNENSKFLSQNQARKFPDEVYRYRICDYMLFYARIPNLQ